jgi:hypothetical protein
LREEPCLVKIFKGISIQYFFAVRSIEPLDVPVLLRLALLDENKFDALTAPIFQRLGDKLRAVIDTEPLGFPAPFHYAVKFTNHALAGQAGIDGDVECFTVEIINDVKSPEWFSMQKAIVNEIHRPGQVMVQGLEQRLLDSGG